MPHTWQGDPTKDVRAMRNMIDVTVETSGLGPRGGAGAKETVRKLLRHCDKMGLPAAEVDAFSQMARGIQDYRGEGDASFTYKADAQSLRLDPIAGATACFPEGATAKVVLSKSGSEVAEEDDVTKQGYWNYVAMVAEKGNYTYQAMGHVGNGQKEPDSLVEIGEGNFCSNVEELGYMAMAMSAEEAAKRRQQERMSDLEAEVPVPADEDDKDGPDGARPEPEIGR